MATIDYLCSTHECRLPNRQQCFTVKFCAASARLLKDTVANASR